MIMRPVRIDGLPFDITYIYSRKRRSLSLEVKEACVVMRAPYGVKPVDLETFIASKKAWLVSKVLEQRERLAELPSYTYDSGCRLPFLGGELELQVSQGKRSMIKRDGGVLFIMLSTRSKLHLEAQIKKQVEKWYRTEALSLLTQKTKALCERHKFHVNAITVRETRSKWGHCTAQGNIQYNWKILLAPESVVDYLVAHEVCHLKHHNHSQTYWQLVENVFPDFDRERLWLKHQGFRLVL